MPVTRVGNTDAYSLTFALPTGARYTIEVTGLQAVAAGLDRAALERWWSEVCAELPRLRVGDESYGAAIDRSLRVLLSQRQPATPVPAPASFPVPPSVWQAWQQDIQESMSQRNAFLDVVERRITASEVALRESEVALRESMNRAIFNAQFTVPVVITGLEAPTMPTPATPPDVSPNEGMEPLPEPTHYLGMAVIRTPNVRVNAVTIQPAPSGRLRYIYVHPTTPTDVWQAEVRRQIARIAQRSAPVSIKQNCRYCGKAYPASQGTSTPDAYCSDRCRHAAADLFDCPVCGGTGRSPSGEGKCGECFGSTYRPCDGCQEDHGRASLMFTNPRTGTVYYVCPSCVDDERNAGGVQAPQASV